jgi:hypothetical protein
MPVRLKAGSEYGGDSTTVTACREYPGVFALATL